METILTMQYLFLMSNVCGTELAIHQQWFGTKISTTKNWNGDFFEVWYRWCKV